MNEYACPECGKTIIEKNDKMFKSEKNIIIKSRLIFLNDDGKVMCRCLECKSIVSLPLSYIQKTAKIEMKNENGVIDI